MNWQPTPWWMRWKGKFRRAVDDPQYDGRHLYTVRKWLYETKCSAINRVEIENP